MTKKSFLVYLEKDSIGSLFLLCNLFGNDVNSLSFFFLSFLFLFFSHIFSPRPLSSDTSILFSHQFSSCQQRLTSFS